MILCGQREYAKVSQENATKQYATQRTLTQGMDIGNPSREPIQGTHGFEGRREGGRKVMGRLPPCAGKREKAFPKKLLLLLCHPGKRCTMFYHSKTSFEDTTKVVCNIFWQKNNGIPLEEKSPNHGKIMWCRKHHMLL